MATFYDGIFKLSQSGGITTLTLTEKLAPCAKASRASAAAKKPKTRKLWGNGKGKFRTRGQYGAATIRGTKWLLQDGCRYTLTRVTQGAVNFRDEVKRKTVIVRKGKSLHGPRQALKPNFRRGTKLLCPISVIESGMLRRLTAVPLALVVVLIAAWPAVAADYTVTTEADGAGSCPALRLPCTLRTAITTANASPGNTIHLPAGHYTLTGALPTITPRR